MISIPSSYKTLWLGLLAAGIGIALVSTHESANADATQPPPPPEVSVVTVTAQPLAQWAEFSGRITAVDFVEVRPEVSGRITEIKFKDGQMVKKGDVILVIDPRPYEASLAQAKAAVAAARSNARFAKTDKERAASLVKTQAISKRLYDERESSNTNAQSLLQAAEAELKQAQINVERAYVKAPIAGKISRPEITVGNVVQAGVGAPMLTTIVSNTGMYADFEVDEQTYLNAMRAGATKKDYTVELKLADGTMVSGKLQSFDNRINPQSGTIRGRALFAGDDGVLVPGMFATVRLAREAGAPVIAVPERAVGTDQSKKYVYVIGDGNKAEFRIITLGGLSEGKRVVLSGLTEGERIVVDGLQRVRPESVVTPVDTQPNAPTIRP